jgi:hypothetical protein
MGDQVSSTRLYLGNLPREGMQNSILRSTFIVLLLRTTVNLKRSMIA